VPAEDGGVAIHPAPPLVGSPHVGGPGDRLLLTVQNRAQVHRKPTGDLVPFSPRRVLPRFVNPRIRSKLLRLFVDGENPST
jgi:hypothetical protein